VTPILQGQKFNEKNPIPKRNPSIVSAASPSTASHAPPTGESDLIDFGQNDSSAPVQPQIPADLKAAQTENGGQQQKELESTLRSTSTSRANEKGQGSLIDFHEDMKASLPVGHALQREDTDTHSVDEFHDAEG